MNTKKIITHTLVLAILTLPALVFAEPGHDANPGVHKSGAPVPVYAGSVAWWSLIAVSVVAMSALSYWVYRYIQVAPVTKASLEKK